MKFLQNLSC